MRLSLIATDTGFERPMVIILLLPRARPIEPVVSLGEAAVSLLVKTMQPPQTSDGVGSNAIRA